MCRRGWSRISVVVVFGLFILGIGMLIPVIQNRREAARRLNTIARLKGIACALHAYHETYRRLPNGYKSRPTHTVRPVSMWFVLLPYLGQEELHKAGRMDAVVPAFIAESDNSTTDFAGTISFAANIRVFAHETLCLRGMPEQSQPVHQALNVPSGDLITSLTLPRIIDGTTSTIMITPRFADCAGQRTWYGTDAYGTGASGPGFGGFVGSGDYTTLAKREGPITATYQLAPSRAECLPDAAIFGHSFHTDGMPVALFDATVKIISPTMSPAIYSKAISPGNERPMDWRDPED